MSTGDSGGAVTFVRFAPEHAPLMYDWLRRPHVADWWDAPPSLDEMTLTLATFRR